MLRYIADGGLPYRVTLVYSNRDRESAAFLDELTTGLDPQARRAIWDLVRDIRERGKTVFLTTHLMEEAERLCSRLAIIDHGRLLALDAPAGLKARAPGGTLLQITLDGDASGAAAGLQGLRGEQCVDELVRLQ